MDEVSEKELFETVTVHRAVTALAIPSIISQVVSMGWLDSGAMPIVCLPNHLSIELADSKNDVDAVIR